jgi:hypothetical protein
LNRIFVIAWGCWLVFVLVGVPLLLQRDIFSQEASARRNNAIAISQRDQALSLKSHALVASQLAEFQDRADKYEREAEEHLVEADVYRDLANSWTLRDAWCHRERLPALGALTLLVPVVIYLVLYAIIKSLAWAMRGFRTT